MRGREMNAYTLGTLGAGLGTVERVQRDLPAIQRGKEAGCNWIESVAGPIIARGDKAGARVRASISALPGVTRVEVDGDTRGATVIVHTKDRGPLYLNGAGFTLAQMHRLDAQHIAGGVR